MSRWPEECSLGSPGYIRKQACLSESECGARSRLGDLSRKQGRPGRVFTHAPHRAVVQSPDHRPEQPARDPEEDH